MRYYQGPIIRETLNLTQSLNTNKFKRIISRFRFLNSDNSRLFFIKVLSRTFVEVKPFKAPGMKFPSLEQTLAELNLLFIRSRSPSNGTFFESPKRVHDFFTILRRNRSFEPCNDCIEFRQSTGKKVKRGTGYSLKLDKMYNIVCKYHDNLILSSNLFKNIINMDVKKSLSGDITPLNEEYLTISRKCSGRHPHCSICGLCHTNCLTHERGHPKY